MTRNLFITIHEDSIQGQQRRRNGRRGRWGSDPEEPLETMPDPSDPEEPLETMPDPSDPEEPLQTMPDPSDPEEPLQTMPDPSDTTWVGVSTSGDSYHPSAQMATRSGAACAGHASSCCCCCDEEKTGSSDDGRDYSGFVITRLAAGLTSETAESLAQLADELGLPALKKALEIKLDEGEQGAVEEGEIRDEEGRIVPPGRLISRPLISLEGCDRRAPEVRLIRDLEALAAVTPLRPLHSLLCYWRIDARAYPERADEIVERLSRLPEVDLAYRELAARDPQLATSGAAFDEDQGYLDDAPVGVGVRWAWKALARLAKDITPSLPTVTVCDLEQRWHSGHQDLATSVDFSTIHGGANRADSISDFGHHGTAVLGQLAAVSQTGGIEGAAAKIAKFILASHYWPGDRLDQGGQGVHPFADTSGHVASGIVTMLVPAAAPHHRALEPGDILLLEVQRGLLPTEIDAADLDAIRLASALGVIVVEAAGNGGVDLDRYVDPATGVGLNRRTGAFRDSGAILVGAAWSALPHNRASFSNYGSRVDCFAWGDSVTSCGYGDLAGNSADGYYTNRFSGTSSAAPVIAGAAALLQALHLATTGHRLRPAQMRATLSDPATGTRQGPKTPGAIGVMPDLCAIVELRLALVPDIYLRRSPCDDGSAQLFGGELGASPDLLLSSLGKADAEKRYGEGPSANDPAPGEPAAGDSQQLYVRARNRGGGVGRIALRLFASPAATLITPERWLPFGNPLKPEKIPEGDLLTVSAPLHKKPPSFNWPPPPAGDPWAGDGPPPLSFLAVARPWKDPGLAAHDLTLDLSRGLPPGGEYFDWCEFRRFLRRKGVAWRNVHLVNAQGAVNLPFLIAGTPDRGRRFSFVIERRLPADAKVKLAVPAALAAKLRQRQPWLANGDTDLVLPRRSRVELGATYLGAGALVRAAFRVEAGSFGPGHSLTLRQLWRGEEVGRISWHFAAPVSG